MLNILISPEKNLTLIECIVNIFFELFFYFFSLGKDSLSVAWNLGIINFRVGSGRILCLSWITGGQRILKTLSFRHSFRCLFHLLILLGYMGSSQATHSLFQLINVLFKNFKIHEVQMNDFNDMDLLFENPALLQSRGDMFTIHIIVIA